MVDELFQFSKHFHFIFQMIRNDVNNQSVWGSVDSGGKLFVHDIETIRYQKSLQAL